MTTSALAGLRERIDGLPPLREVAAASLPARKSLGQHFLFDLNLTDKIARTARPAGATTEAPLEGTTVVEVGPGPGGLTRSLLKAGANVIAIEKDQRASEVLAPLIEAAEGRLTLITADALSADWTAIAPPGTTICANLPYNVATPLIVDWLTGPWPPWWASATVMVQREVADRIVAAPASADYGRLSVLTGARAFATSVFDVSPAAFVPPPKVWSSVVRIDPKPDTGVPLKALERVTAAAFGQRRKMLRSSLKALTREPETLLAAAGIEPTERAERISVEDFIRLAHAWEATNEDTPAAR
ncbi:16S rRNA (adenine(1518)-N(6)/adenine(1519)-N(6))-dimethyltransferase RsmA [Acuticoccus sediminis]|uniref:16S rRNA (adenine(1518)-N(6)/adenine(1519)-N(6))- dimethyltransferase RsmA n=1 Tax=Acuticoccus sediminis TaxID=2184697 RepID=UPI001CFC8D66|nr:16S rRNA (adenine(1518)-N(6)/adenine(1519)-N(6))-dimethyltransferase RsmA [Acuticoccus sediminis]